MRKIFGREKKMEGSLGENVASAETNGENATLSSGLHRGKRGIEFVCEVLRSVLFLGFGVQIALGVIWICCNFFHVQAFAEEESFLYGIFLACTLRQPQVIYLLQLLAAFFSAYFLLYTLGVEKKGHRIFGALSLMTFPMALQCHLALLPYSLAGSILFLAWAFIIRFWKAGRKMWSCLLCIMISLCMTFGVGMLNEKLAGAEQESFAYHLFHRTSWPFFLQDLGGWPKGLQAALGDDGFEISFNPGNVEKEMKPLMEEMYTEAEADAIYMETVKDTWSRRKSVILTHMRWDVIGYSATPLVLKTQLEGGNYDSYSGRNVEIMRNVTPNVTKWVIAYTCAWFPVGIALGAVITLLRWIREGHFPWKKELGGIALVELSAITLVCFYTMQGAGIMDYKKTFAVSSIWLIWALLAMEKQEE